MDGPVVRCTRRYGIDRHGQDTIDERFMNEALPNVENDLLEISDGSNVR